MRQATQVSVEAEQGDELRVSPLPQLVPVIEGYERWAPMYDDAPNPLLAREERYLTPLLATLHFESALDLACGTGRWIEKLVQRGCASGIGIDLSSAMLRVAERKDVIKGRLAQADCERLPFAAATSDLAICSFALGHIHNLKPAVCELQRVSKPGANVLVSDLHPDAYQRGWRVGFRDQRTSVQIEAEPHSADEIVGAFSTNRFECISQQDLWLGEPERPLFARAGKLESFADACQLPAVLVCHFRRVG